MLSLFSSGQATRMSMVCRPVRASTTSLTRARPSLWCVREYRRRGLSLSLTLMCLLHSAIQAPTAAAAAFYDKVPGSQVYENGYYTYVCPFDLVQWCCLQTRATHPTIACSPAALQLGSQRFFLVRTDCEPALQCPSRGCVSLSSLDPVVMR